MIFRRDRFGELVRRQLDLFADDEAEEAYGDYQLVLEAIVERLEELRDTYGRTLDEQARDEYGRSFGRAARKRFPALTGLG